MAAFFSAFLTVLCFKFVFMAILAKRILTFIHFKDHISASSAVSAVRISEGGVSVLQ